MDRDRRSKESHTRQFMMAALNDAQRVAINQVEMCGWCLIFVRKPLGQSAIPALKNSDSGRYAIVKPDGSLNEDQKLIVRQLLSS